RGAYMTAPSQPRTGRPAEAFCESTSLCYLEAGESGPHVVLLPGWSAFKELWWSTFVALGQLARAFAPGMPGHGGWALPGSRGMSLLAARIARFCGARGLERVGLVGHSMGGNVALELALARPDLVESLVLVDPAVQPTEMPPFTRSYLDQTFGWAALR